MTPRFPPYSPTMWLPSLLVSLLISQALHSALILEEDFESQPFSDDSPAGSWVRGEGVYLENYSAGGGILDRAAADLGARCVSLNPTPATAWLYQDTGQTFAPNTTYTLTLYAGSRQNSSYQGGGPIEFGLWSGIPGNPATELALMPDQLGGEGTDTSTSVPQTMVKVTRYSFTTGSDVSGLGNIVVFARNLADGSGRSSIDQIVLESEGTLPDRPNILWLVAEDMSPTLGCYGDPVATSPRLDALAAEGQRFNMCWSNGPFCSVSRTTLISGTYATRTGGSMHRSADTLTAPDFMRFYPRLLQEAGYYTTNNSKEDYNIQPSASEPWRKGWHDSSNTATWRNRPTGRPFFSVFNLDTTHESRIRPVGGTFPVTRLHDPADVILPDCHPDIPKLRESWASHYDYIAQMDQEAGALLDQLEADGLAEDTIIFFYADHGSCVPGYKRFVGNRGQHAPLIVRFPPKYRHLAPEGYESNSSSDELISFVDFPATLLSLLDCEIPEWMHGRAFAGPRAQEEPDYLAGYICRHDTRIANARSVTDGRYVYIRNYQSDTPDGNWSAYTNGDTGTNPDYATLGAGEWLHDFWHGRLSEREAHFFINQGYEQLYDLETDPDETINLVDDPNSLDALNRLRGYLDQWHAEHRDGGLIAEGQLYELIDASGKTAWDVIGDDTLFDYELVLETAKLANSGDPTQAPLLADRLTHPDPTVQLWATRGLAYLGRQSVRAHQSALVSAAAGSNYWVAVAADQALAKHATEPTRTNSLNALFTRTERSGVVINGVVNRALEREIHFAGDAISSLSYLAPSYRNRTTSMNNETYTTRAYRRQIFYWFFDEYSHPLAQFRSIHGLDKTGADDFDNPSGDGVSNLLRYAFNLSPSDGDLMEPATPRNLAPGGEQGLPLFYRDPLTQNIHYQFVRRKSSTDSRVLTTAHFSPNLLDWSESPLTGTIESIDEVYERVSIELEGEEAAFFRVEVQK